MVKSLKMLPALAMVLAATLAFGFTPNTPPTPEHGYDGAWIEVTGLTPGASTYQCDADPQACTRKAPNSTAQVVKTGIFVNNMD